MAQWITGVVPFKADLMVVLRLDLNMGIVFGVSAKHRFRDLYRVSSNSNYHSMISLKM